MAKEARLPDFPLTEAFGDKWESSFCDIIFQIQVKSLKNEEHDFGTVSQTFPNKVLAPKFKMIGLNSAAALRVCKPRLAASSA